MNPLRSVLFVSLMSFGLVLAGLLRPAFTADDRLARQRMIDQLAQFDRTVTNRAVLNAMARVPRHEFVPEPFRARAYEDCPLPIGYGQTISQPYIVAFMTQALEPKPTDRVLEVGTGSGYQAAILAEVVGQVYSIEIIEELASRAAADAWREDDVQGSVAASTCRSPPHQTQTSDHPRTGNKRAANR